MNSNEIKEIAKANKAAGYVSPRDIARLCDYTLRLRDVMKDVQEHLHRTAIHNLITAMVDIILED